MELIIHRFEVGFMSFSLFLFLAGCLEKQSNPLSIDDDLDGASEFDGDCDDFDPSLNVDDVDGDGFSTCDGDCDDNDASDVSFLAIVIKTE